MCVLHSSGDSSVLHVAVSVTSTPGRTRDSAPSDQTWRSHKDGWCFRSQWDTHAVTLKQNKIITNDKLNVGAFMSKIVIWLKICVAPQQEPKEMILFTSVQLYHMYLTNFSNSRHLLIFFFLSVALQPRRTSIGFTDPDTRTCKHYQPQRCRAEHTDTQHYSFPHAPITWTLFSHCAQVWCWFGNLHVVRCAVRDITSATAQ